MRRSAFLRKLFVVLTINVSAAALTLWSLMQGLAHIDLVLGETVTAKTLSQLARTLLDMAGLHDAAELTSKPITQSNVILYLVIGMIVPFFAGLATTEAVSPLTKLKDEGQMQ
jgi:hypothetical protein